MKQSWLGWGILLPLSRYQGDFFCDYYNPSYAICVAPNSDMCNTNEEMIVTEQIKKSISKEQTEVR